MMHSVTKVIPIHFTDSKRDISITNHTGSISHHILPLVINALGGGHTHAHRHTHTDTHTYTHAHTFTRTHNIPNVMDKSNFKKPSVCWPIAHT